MSADSYPGSRKRGREDDDPLPVGVNSDGTGPAGTLADATASSHVLKGHSESVSQVVVVPESCLIVTACCDGHLRVFARDGGGDALHDLDAHRAGEVCWGVSALACLGGDIIASGGGEDGIVSTWLASSGLFLESLQLPLRWDDDDGVSCYGVAGLTVAGSRNDCLVVTNLGKYLTFISHNAGRKLRVMSVEHTQCADTIHVSTHGDLVVAVGFDGEVSIFSATTCKLVNVLRGHTSWALHASFSKQYIAAVSYDHILHLHSNVEGYPLFGMAQESSENRFLGKHKNPVDYAKLVGDHFLITASRNMNGGGSRLRFRCLPACETLLHVDVEINCISNIAITVDGRLACVGEGGERALIVTPPALVSASVKEQAALLFGRYSTMSLMRFMRSRSLGMRAPLV